MLRDPAGRYLSVSGGTEGEGVQVGFYEADGVAPYNTWYFTETDWGITIKSALSQGEYYLTENTKENRLELSTSAGSFELGDDGLSAWIPQRRGVPGLCTGDTGGCD